MAQLTDFPFINQLNSPTLDGGPDNNKWFNCVICAVLSCILYYHPDYRGTISPDEMKDAVYGASYQNAGTDITRFLQYANQHGVAFSSVSGPNATLVQEAHNAIAAGKPVIMTEVDPYVDTSLPQYKDWLHSGTFYAEGPGTLTLMDPFGGKLVEKSDSEWEQVLRTDAIWIASNAVQPKPAPVAKPLELSAHLVAAGWHDDGTHLWEPKHQYAFREGFRAAVLKAGESYDPQNVPLEDEHYQPRLEDSHPELGDGDQQLTLLGGFNWNTKYGVHPMAAGAEVQTNRAQITRLYAALELAKQDITLLIGLLNQHGIAITTTGGTHS